MPAIHAINVNSLTPDQQGIDITVKVLHLVVALNVTDDETGNKVSVFEYIVADATGSINVKTLSELEPGQWVRFEGAYTEVIDGYLRLVAGSTMTATTGSGQVNTENNRSFVKIVRAA